MSAVNLPRFNSKSVSTKDIVISILGDQWPLSAKEIFTRLGKKSDTQVSYQAVHKLLAQLCGEKVLEKGGGRYQLSKAWIASAKQFITALEKKYESKETFIRGINEFKGSFEFDFNDITDFSLSMADMLLSDRVAKSKGRYRMVSLRYGWWPLTFSFDHIALLRKILKAHLSTPYAIIQKDSSFGRWLNRQYNAIGFKSKIIPGLDEYNDDILVSGSLIAQVNYSVETKKAIDVLYNKISDLRALFKEYVKPTFPKKGIEIHFKITENPALAATLGKHYMDIWNSR